MIQNILSQLPGRGKFANLLRRFLSPKERVKKIAGFPSDAIFGLSHSWESESNMIFFGCPPSIRLDLLFIKKHSRSKGNVADIGANIGMYGLFFYKELLGTGDKVYAFEPVPELFARLKRNVELNGAEDSVSLERLAISDKEGALSLSLPDDLHKKSGSASLTFTTDNYISVPSRTLDSYSKNLGRISLIKIDVEGAEPMVLAGAQEILRRDRPFVFFEVNAENFKGGFLEAKTIFVKLLPGYDIFFQNGTEAISLEESFRKDLIKDGNWWAKPK